MGTRGRRGVAQAAVVSRRSTLDCIAVAFWILRPEFRGARSGPLGPVVWEVGRGVLSIPVPARERGESGGVFGSWDEAQQVSLNEPLLRIRITRLWSPQKA